jgi:hypothetical protein
MAVIYFFAPVVEGKHVWVQWAVWASAFIWILYISFSSKFDLEKKAVKKLLEAAMAEDRVIFYNENVDATIVSFDIKPKLKPYRSIVASARREAIEAYVKKVILKEKGMPPSELMLRTEEGDAFRVVFAGDKKLDVSIKE